MWSVLGVALGIVKFWNTDVRSGAAKLVRKCGIGEHFSLRRFGFEGYAITKVRTGIPSVV